MLVAAWIGSTNLGDELVFAAIATKLRARGVAPLAVSVDPTATRADHGTRAVGASRLVRRPSLVRTSSAMVFGGGGLVQDRTSPFNLPLHLSRTWIARAGRTPFAGIGLGVGPLTTRAGRQLARRSLAAATGLSCRDSGSADLIASLGLARPVVAADPAITLPRPPVERSDRIVVSLRPWTARRSLVPVAQRRQRSDPAPAWFLDGAARALDAAAERTGLAVHFVAFQADRDDAVHRLVAQRMRTGATTAVPDVRTVLDEVATARVMVGMRYHAGIAATLAGIPSVLVAYDPKVPSLAAELGRGGVGLGWSADGLARIPDAVASVLDRNDDVAAAHAALHTREQRNDVVLDHLLEVAGLR